MGPLVCNLLHSSSDLRSCVDGSIELERECALDPVHSFSRSVPLSFSENDYFALMAQWVLILAWAIFFIPEQSGKTLLVLAESHRNRSGHSSVSDSDGARDSNRGASVLEGFD